MASFRRLDRDDEIVPLSRPVDRYSSCSLDIVQIVSGMVFVKLLAPRFNEYRLLKRLIYEGIVPPKLLSDRSSMAIFTHFVAKVVERTEEPLRKFPWTSNLASFVRVERAVGMDPDKQLAAKYSSVNDDMRPNKEGNVPDKQLYSRCTAMIDVSLLSVVGMVPLSEL